MSKVALRISFLFVALPMQPGTAQEDEAAVRAKIARIKQDAEPKWQRIPWVASLSDARRLSEKERRPVFLFTYDGNLDIGRC